MWGVGNKGGNKGRRVANQTSNPHSGGVQGEGPVVELRAINRWDSHWMAVRGKKDLGWGEKQENNTRHYQ